MVTKICIVGLGYWGPILVRNFYNLKNVELSVCDKDQDKVLKIVKNYQDIKTFSDYKNVLKSDVDGIVLATNPLSTHYTMGKQALEHKKHLWLEKPMASTSKEAKELIEIAENNGVLLHIDHTFEYSPHVQHIKKVLEHGDLGDILYVSFDRQNLGLYQKDYNVIWDLCPHDFSILNYWFGMPCDIKTMNSCKSFGVADIENIFVSYENFNVDIRASWRHPEKVRKTIIIGSEKMLVYDDVAKYKIRIHDMKVELVKGKYKYTRNTQQYASLYEEWEPLARESSHFVECIEKGVKTNTPGESGLKVMWLLEKCQ